MGIHNCPDKCFITDSPTINHPSSWDLIEYYSEYSGNKFFFSFPSDHQNSEKVEKNKYILKGLIINGRFPEIEKNFYNNEILEKIIDEAVIPTTPKEKLDELIMFIYESQESIGSYVDFDDILDHETLLNKLYLQSNDEFWFYMKTLQEMKYVTFDAGTTNYGNAAINLRLTYSGLEYITQMIEEGAKSKKCFIAMWFHSSQIETREAIRQTVIDCGYNPVIIDEEHYESDITINDAIIQNIKRCKFLIADFTGQRAGVYFESGYALGKGKPVIYMCSAEDFKNRHFDTDHFPHIRYESLDQLKRMLENKIKAWID